MAWVAGTFEGMMTDQGLIFILGFVNVLLNCCSVHYTALCSKLFNFVDALAGSLVFVFKSQN